MGRTLSKGRLAPALIVAVLAVGACVAGVATAGPDAEVSAITKKKVKKVSKKVANKQITARAPGLLVGDSDKLDGLHAAELSPATSVETSTDQALTGDFEVVLSTGLTTAANATIIATGVVELNSNGGDDDLGRCRLRIAGQESVNFISDVPDADTDRVTLTSVYGAVVGAGTHAVDLLCNANNTDVESEAAGLIAAAHPTG